MYKNSKKAGNKLKGFYSRQDRNQIYKLQFKQRCQLIKLKSITKPPDNIVQ